MTDHKPTSDELAQQRTDLASERTGLATQRTDLAFKRTVMAAERTLMAWVRTGLSVTSFGFTIYKILQGIADRGVALNNPELPRQVGLFLTGMGTVCMVMGITEYLGTMRSLREEQPVRFIRSALVMALGVGALSLFLFFGIFLRAA